MSLSDPSPAVKQRTWLWRSLAVLLIVTAGGLRVAYFAFDCPLDLAPDEAHYWDWSRHLDWSYYSKGPLVAYLIRAGCFLVGPWSQQLTGNEMLAVRLPAVICGSLLLLSLYILTVQVFGRESLALAVVAIGLCSPLLAAGSSLMTIDSPYTCCWGWALVLGHHAIFRRVAWSWPALGLVVGLGILAKYTMVLWLPSAGLFLLTTPQYRALLIRPGFWVLAGVAGLSCLPILIWNIQHGGVTFLHVGGQAGLSNDSGIRWWGPLAYLGLQFAILIGFWFVAWILALYRYRPWADTDEPIAYLWWMSVPMFGVFFVFSCLTKIEPNWPVTAYISGLVLATAWLAETLRTGSKRAVSLARSGLISCCAIGLALIFLIHESEWFYPVLRPVVGAPTEKSPTPVRRLDPTCRLRGWRILAEEIDRVRDQLRSEGIEPVLAGSSWTLPGQVGFYCRGNPTVYSFGLLLGDRHSQYDLWRPNPISDEDLFSGQTFIVVGDVHPHLQDSFDRVEVPRLVSYQVGDQPVAWWTISICRGFRGVPKTSQLAGRRY